MAGFFESRRGRVSLGLLVMSLGGQVLMHVLQAVEDPQITKILQAAIIFWVIFSLKMIYHYAWLEPGAAAATPAAAAAPAGKAVKAAKKADDEPAAPRRRRGQRA